MSDGKHEGKFQAYVCGFVFDPDFKEVMLIRKNRPEWQAGKLNGVGGHVEDTDHDAAHAMSRECEEESGLYIPPSAWRNAVRAHFPSAQVDFFYAVHDPTSGKSLTDETVMSISVKRLSTLERTSKETPLPNLQWLIPFCVYSSRKFEGTQISELLHVYEN